MCVCVFVCIRQSHNKALACNSMRPLKIVIRQDIKVWTTVNNTIMIFSDTNWVGWQLIQNPPINNHLRMFSPGKLSFKANT